MASVQPVQASPCSAPWRSVPSSGIPPWRAERGSGPSERALRLHDLSKIQFDNTVLGIQVGSKTWNVLVRSQFRDAGHRSGPKRNWLMHRSAFNPGLELCILAIPAPSLAPELTDVRRPWVCMSSFTSAAQALRGTHWRSVLTLCSVHPSLWLTEQVLG